ncbi:hypothetical protein ACFQ10_54505 [Streptomyces indonesiensis]
MSRTAPPEYLDSSPRAAGAAVGAAALAGRKKRSKVSTVRKVTTGNRSGGGFGRSGGGAGKGGLLGRGGGRGWGGGAAGGGGRGRTNGTGSVGTGAGRRLGGGSGRGLGGRGSGNGRNGRGPGGLLGEGGRRKNKGGGLGGANSPGANALKGTGGKNHPGKAGAHQQSRSGKAWQTLKGWGNRMRRTNGGATRELRFFRRLRHQRQEHRYRIVHARHDPSRARAAQDARLGGQAAPLEEGQERQP